MSNMAGSIILHFNLYLKVLTIVITLVYDMMQQIGLNVCQTVKKE